MKNLILVPLFFIMGCISKQPVYCSALQAATIAAKPQCTTYSNGLKIIERCDQGCPTAPVHDEDGNFLYFKRLCIDRIPQCIQNGNLSEGK